MKGGSLNTSRVYLYLQPHLKKREIINNRKDFKRTKSPLLLAKDIPNSCAAIQDEQAPLVGNCMTNILKDSSPIKDVLAYQEHQDVYDQQENVRCPSD